MERSACETFSLCMYVFGVLGGPFEQQNMHLQLCIANLESIAASLIQDQQPQEGFAYEISD
jgi:hypothetical protein